MSRVRADRPLRLWIFGFLFAAALGALGPLRARAEPLRGLRSVVHVPAGLPCLSQEPLIDAVRMWLGNGALDPRLDVRVDEGGADGASFVSYTVLRDGVPSASRTLSPAPAQCEAREAVLALAVALALRASHTGELAAFLEPAPLAARQLSMAAGVLRGLGVLPAASTGASAELALDVPGWFGAALLVAGRFAPSVALGEQGGQFSARVLSAGLRGCVRTPELARLSARLCLGADAGAFRAVGSGFARVWSRRAPYAAAAGSLALGVRLGAGLGLELRGSAAIPLFPVAVRSRDAEGEVLQRTLPAFGGELGLGLRYQFSGR